MAYELNGFIYPEIGDLVIRKTWKSSYHGTKEYATFMRIPNDPKSKFADETKFIRLRPFDAENQYSGEYGGDAIFGIGFDNGRKAPCSALHILPGYNTLESAGTWFVQTDA